MRLYLGKQPRASIAIFGGSFDPPHIGHQEIVTKALMRLDVDKIVVVPTHLNPFKSTSLATSTQRLVWCQQLFGALERVEVSDFEVNASRSVYTSETVQHFQSLYEVKYLIIGSDNLVSLEKWHAFAWLNREVTWVIATREGQVPETSMLHHWKVLEVDVPVSSTEIRQGKVTSNVDERIQDSVSVLIEHKKNENKGKENR